MNILDLIEMSDGCDDKVYFKIHIGKKDGSGEIFQDRIVMFPYDGESVEIIEMNFSGHRGCDTHGRPLPSILNDIVVLQTKDCGQTGHLGMVLDDGGGKRNCEA